MGELEIIFLGTGTSQGVPIIGCDCITCKSSDPRDQRFRTSILLRTNSVSLLIDTSPDFRTQCLRENIRKVDAVLYTHSHTDHVMGFDDLRRFCEMADSDLPIYAVSETLNDLKRIFPYAFQTTHSFLKNYMRAAPREIKGEFSLGDLRIIPVALPHGRFTTTGFVFFRGARKLLAYYTDCKSVPPEAQEAARGAEILVLDALRHVPHPTHLTLQEATEAAQRLSVRGCYFTHMSHDLKHEETESTLPLGIRLAYDGLQLRI
ncbi:MAG: MBL fold metallo-hydrolase [Verrucomicrobia bacterium]|nr:MAG: MBL fold metallo-hydrolase [Verrucomicrobiota bacterium]